MRIRKFRERGKEAANKRSELTEDAHSSKCSTSRVARLRSEKGEITMVGAKYKDEVDKRWAKPGGLPARNETRRGG